MIESALSNLRYDLQLIPSTDLSIQKDIRVLLVLFWANFLHRDQWIQKHCFCTFSRWLYFVLCILVL